MDLIDYLKTRSELINFGKRIVMGSDDKVAKPHLRHYPSALFYIPQGVPDEIDASSMCARKCIFSMLGFPVAQASKISIEHFYRGHLIAAGESEALNAVVHDTNKERIDANPILSELVQNGWHVFDDISNPAIMSFQGYMEDCSFVDSGRYDMILSPDDNPMNAEALLEELKAPNDGNFTSKRSLASNYYLQSSTYTYHHPSKRCALCARSGSTEHYQYWATTREDDLFVSRLVAGNGMGDNGKVQIVTLKGMVEGRKHIEKFVKMFLTEEKYNKLSAMTPPKDKRQESYPCSWAKSTSFCEYHDYCWSGYPLAEWHEVNEPLAREQLFMIDKQKTREDAVNAG